MYLTQQTYDYTPKDHDTTNDAAFVHYTQKQAMTSDLHPVQDYPFMIHVLQGVNYIMYVNWTRQFSYTSDL